MWGIRRAKGGNTRIARLCVRKYSGSIELWPALLLFVFIGGERVMLRGKAETIDQDLYISRQHRIKNITYGSKRAAK